MAYLSVPAGWMSTTMSINRKRLEKPLKIYLTDSRLNLGFKLKYLDSEISRHANTFLYCFEFEKEKGDIPI